jgi:hypothetical protein
MQTIDQTASPVDATPEYASHKSQPIEGTPVDVRHALLFGALGAVVLIWVALYNGYPTVFPDTGSYLLTGAIHVAFAPFRAPGYSVFTSWTSFGASGWFTTATQAILVVYVLHETCAYLIGGDRKFVGRCLFAAVCLLAALTSLPWLVSLLMPDVFAGILFLCAFLLAYAAELRLLQRICLASIVMIAVAAHASLIPIAAMYIAVLSVLKFYSRQTRGLSFARSVLAWLLVPILVAGFWTATWNQKMGLGFRLSPSGNAFLLGRLFGDGLASDFLRDNCPKRSFVSCRYLSNLPRTEGQFMFQHPLLPALKGHEEEIEIIVRGTILAYPRRFLMSSAKQTLLQLAALRTGEEIRTSGADHWNYNAIQRAFPGDLQSFTNSRQFRDSLLPLANAASVVHTATFWLSLAACLVFAWTRRFARMNEFLAYAILFLIINAAVCGALAGVYDRYQSRVAWLMPFCLIAYICCLIKEWKHGAVRQDSTCP